MSGFEEFSRSEDEQASRAAHNYAANRRHFWRVVTILGVVVAAAAAVVITFWLVAALQSADVSAEGNEVDNVFAMPGLWVVIGLVAVTVGLGIFLRVQLRREKLERDSTAA